MEALKRKIPYKITSLENGAKAKVEPPTAI